MGKITFKGFAKNISRERNRLSKEGRGCPMGCIGELGVCLGRCQHDTGRVVLIDSEGILWDVSPDNVNHVADCPVVRNPGSSIIVLG